MSNGNYDNQLTELIYMYIEVMYTEVMTTGFTLLNLTLFAVL